MRIARETQYRSHYSHYLFQEGQAEGSGGPTCWPYAEHKWGLKRVLNYYICQISYITLRRNINQIFMEMTRVHVLCPTPHPNPPEQLDPNASHCSEGQVVIFILQGLAYWQRQGSKTLFSLSFRKICRISNMLDNFFSLWLCTTRYPSVTTRTGQTREGLWRVRNSLTLN